MTAVSPDFARRLYRLGLDDDAVEVLESFLDAVLRDLTRQHNRTGLLNRRGVVFAIEGTAMEGWKGGELL